MIDLMVCAEGVRAQHVPLVRLPVGGYRGYPPCRAPEAQRNVCEALESVSARGA